MNNMTVWEYAVSLELILITYHYDHALIKYGIPVPYRTWSGQRSDSVTSTMVGVTAFEARKNLPNIDDSIWFTFNYITFPHSLRVLDYVLILSLCLQSFLYNSFSKNLL